MGRSSVVRGPSAWGGSSGSGSGGAPGPASPAGTGYIHPGNTGPNITTLVCVAGSYYYFMAEFASAVTIDRFGINLNALLGTDEFVVGLYNATSAWVPGTLVVQSSELVANTTGFKELTIASTAVPAGRYLTCVQANQASTLVVRRGGAVSSGLVLGVAGASLSHYSVTGVYSTTMPATGTAWDTQAGVDNISGNQSGVAVRTV